MVHSKNSFFTIILIFFTLSVSSQAFFEDAIFHGPLPNTSDQAGSAVAMDGQFALTGARANFYGFVFSNPDPHGKALAFEMDANGQWVQTQTLVASDSLEYSRFGSSVAMDGNHAVIGAPLDDHPAAIWNGLGAAYFFERGANGVWTETAKVTAPNPELGDWFGNSVTISGDFAFIGAYNEDEDAAGLDSLTDAGSVFVFKHDGNGGWNYVQKLVATDRTAFSHFGQAVCVDGDVAMVTAKGAETSSGVPMPVPNTGAAYVFEKDSNGMWNEIQKIESPHPAEGAQFGASVALEGSTAVIGTPNYREVVPGAQWTSHLGRAYTFSKNAGGTWVPTDTLTASDGDLQLDITGNFGYSVGLSNNRIVIGAPREPNDTTTNNPLSEAGAVYVYQSDGSGSWNEVQKLVTSDRDTSDHFGFSVAIDGQHIFAGAENEGAFTSSENVQRGAVYFFRDTTSGVINTIDVRPLHSSDLRAFPNPTAGRVTVRTESLPFHRIRVLSVHGSLVSDTKFSETQTQVFSIKGGPGIYLVEVYGNDNVPHRIKVLKTE